MLERCQTSAALIGRYHRTRLPYARDLWCRASFNLCIVLSAMKRWQRLIKLRSRKSGARAATSKFLLHCCRRPGCSGMHLLLLPRQAIEITTAQRWLPLLGHRNWQKPLQPAGAQNATAKLRFLGNALQQRPCAARLELLQTVTMKSGAGWRRIIKK